MSPQADTWRQFTSVVVVSFINEYINALSNINGYDNNYVIARRRNKEEELKAILTWR